MWVGKALRTGHWPLISFPHSPRYKRRQAGRGNEDAAHLQGADRVALRLLRRDWGCASPWGAPEGKRAQGQS